MVNFEEELGYLMDAELDKRMNLRFEDYISKQRVKEVIDKATDLTNKNEVNKYDLLKGLGLDKED